MCPLTMRRLNASSRLFGTNGSSRRVTTSHPLRLSIDEARIVWRAAQQTGYPFGTHVQLMLLMGCRLDEWSSAQSSWVDLKEGLFVVPREGYKTHHVHVVPLVPRAVELLKAIPERPKGEYLLSSDDGRTPHPRG